MAKALEGEWILEQKIDGIDALGEISTLYVPEDVDQIAMLYHFYNDGTGWKEFHVLYEGEVESIIVSRYESKFNYTVDAQGKVSVNFTDAEGIANGKHAELKFDGAKLTDKIEDIDAELQRATDAQIKKYQDEADKWHGGADADAETVDLSKVESNFTAQNGMTLTGKLKANLNVTVAPDAIVTLKDVTIDAGPNQPGIICLGTASIFVEGENNVKGAPGVTVQYDKADSNRRIMIKGSGKLNATGYDNAAGIGSAYGTSCARIFLGANITATGGKNAAGIGCNDKASSDPFQIGSRCDIIRITAAAKKVEIIKGEGATYSIGFSNCYTKAAINDIVFGRTPWFSAKFLSEEYENALKECPFIYPKN